MNEAFSLAQAKERFLLKYNADRSTGTAVGMAIGAALGRNTTYSGAYDKALRSVFRAEWGVRLRAIAHEAQLFDSVGSTYAVVQAFRNEMRLVISHGVAAKRLPDADFRISHAQKSISVYLKHLWCMGLIPMPAVCPVDRVSMTAANAPYPLRSWGHVDSIDHHTTQLEYLLGCAAGDGLPLAEWELLKFAPSRPVAEVADQVMDQFALTRPFSPSR